MSYVATKTVFDYVLLFEISRLLREMLLVYSILKASLRIYYCARFCEVSELL